MSGITNVFLLCCYSQSQSFPSYSKHCKGLSRHSFIPNERLIVFLIQICVLFQYFSSSFFRKKQLFHCIRELLVLHFHLNYKPFYNHSFILRRAVVHLCCFLHSDVRQRLCKVQAALWVNKTGSEICQDKILEAYSVCFSCSLLLDALLLLYLVKCALC